MGIEYSLLSYLVYLLATKTLLCYLAIIGEGKAL